MLRKEDNYAESSRIFTEEPGSVFATVGRDGKAKCRPFMFCFEKEGKLWFCTNNTKDVYKDMLANPEIEVSVSSCYKSEALWKMCGNLSKAVH